MKSVSSFLEKPMQATNRRNDSPVKLLENSKALPSEIVKGISDETLGLINNHLPKILGTVIAELAQKQTQCEVDMNSSNPADLLRTLEIYQAMSLVLADYLQGQRNQLLLVINEYQSSISNLKEQFSKRKQLNIRLLPTLKD